jgi:hypothetical protein
MRPQPENRAAQARQRRSTRCFHALNSPSIVPFASRVRGTSAAAKTMKNNEEQ